MNVVLVIPTGIGAEIGGHAGDANPVCKLLARVADTLVTHPNVVNASDINEMSENVWYVEGSLLDRFLAGEFALRQPLQNRIVVVANPPVRNDTRNAVNAARVTIGINAEIVELWNPLQMVARFERGKATGDVSGWQSLVTQLAGRPFDALAIHTPIDVDRDVALAYYREGGMNPWGGVEAKASKLIASKLNRPVAHAPLETATSEDLELHDVVFEQVDPRIAPEVISCCYLHSVLKGLNRAPRIARNGLQVEDIDAMVAPASCYGPAHTACAKRGIPVIAVRENATIYDGSGGEFGGENFIRVENYWEAAGVLMCMKAGIAPESVRRPLKPIA